jgi:hypothetical protein
MTSLHHHHHQHHQEPSKAMLQHQAVHQQNLLLERRIIQLLTETNLTFKEIIIKLEGENLNASIGMIRRINRDNRYRRPRYDSKLTPVQRESLVEELRDHKGLKPNLSLLAKRYGVCHGSVWYWWDKLNRLKHCDAMTRRNTMTTNGVGSSSNRSSSNNSSNSNSNNAKSKFRIAKTQLQLYSVDGRARRRRSFKIGANLLDDHDQAALGNSQAGKPGKSRQSRRKNIDILLDQRFDLVGRVSIVGGERIGDLNGCPIDLPILMFAPKESDAEKAKAVVESSGSVGVSPSSETVADEEEDEEDDEDEYEDEDVYDEDEEEEDEEEDEEEEEEEDEEDEEGATSDDVQMEEAYEADEDGTEMCDSCDGSSSYKS